jgi:hypothetical protein
LGIAAFLPQGVIWAALAAGWLVAVGNAILARVINRRAVGCPRDAFLRWAVGGNALRVAALLAVFAAVALRSGSGRDSFLAGGFSGLFVFMILEIAELLRADARTQERM